MNINAVLEALLGRNLIRRETKGSRVRREVAGRLIRLPRWEGLTRIRAIDFAIPTEQKRSKGVLSPCQMSRKQSTFFFSSPTQFVLAPYPEVISQGMIP